MIKNMEKEIWKPVVGYEEMYEVSNLGRVRSLAFVYPWRGSFKTNKPTLLKPWSDTHGYKQVSIRGKYMLVHRLVALAFVPNPLNLPKINHKDENPSNNRVENLEWCTQKYNVAYSQEKTTRRIIETHGRPVYRIDLATGKRFDYPYINAVAIDGFAPKQVSAVCSGLYAKSVKLKNPHKYRNNFWYYG